MKQRVAFDKTFRFKYIKIGNPKLPWKHVLQIGWLVFGW